MAAALSNKEKTNLIVVMIFGAIALIVAEIIFHAWVLSILWGWFWVSTFNLPILSIPAAIGISATLKFATGFYSKIKSQDSKKEVMEKIVVAFATPIVVLAFGWVAKLFL